MKHNLPLSKGDIHNHTNLVLDMLDYDYLIPHDSFILFLDKSPFIYFSCRTACKIQYLKHSVDIKGIEILGKELFS